MDMLIKRHEERDIIISTESWPVVAEGTASALTPDKKLRATCAFTARLNVVQARWLLLANLTITHTDAPKVGDIYSEHPVVHFVDDDTRGGNPFRVLRDMAQWLVTGESLGATMPIWTALKKIQENFPPFRP